MSATHWIGPSLFDGSEIRAVFYHSTGNPTTGPMDSIAFEPNREHQPGDELHPRSTCGDCQLRNPEPGKPRCYVCGYHVAEIRKIAASPDWFPHTRDVRIGAHGDPASVPAHVLRSMVALYAAHTGYTEEWRNRPDLRDLCMASVGSEAERAEAKALGWRTFRRLDVGDKLQPDEALCRAKNGERVTCSVCGRCSGGTDGPDVATPLHDQRNRGLAMVAGVCVRTNKGKA